MATNYDELQAAAALVIARTDTLRDKTNVLSTAEKDVDQTQAIYDQGVEKFDAKQAQVNEFTSIISKASTLYTQLDNQRTALKPQLGARESPEPTLPDPPVGTTPNYLTPVAVTDAAGTGAEGDVQNAERKIDYIEKEIALIGSGLAGVNGGVSLIDTENAKLDTDADADPVPVRNKALDLIYASRVEIERLEGVVAEATKDRAAILAVDPTRDVSAYTTIINDSNDNISALKDTTLTPALDETTTVTDLTALNTDLSAPDVGVSQLEALVTLKDAAIKVIYDEVNLLVSIMNQKRTEKENKATELVGLIATRDSIANQLQDIEGEPVAGVGLDDTPGINPPYTAAPYLTAPYNTALVGSEDCQLRMVKIEELAATDSKVDAEVELAALTVAKTTRLNRLTAAKGVLTTASGEAGTAQTQLDLAWTTLRNEIEEQKNIEIDAAALLLEEFLINGAAVINSSAPVVATSIRNKIDQTCPNAKVRTFVELVEAAYASEEAYVKLRTQIAADPVGSFFNAIEDPCFNLLPADELAALRAAIKDGFAARASELFALYFPSGASTSSGSSNTWLVVVLAIIALVAVVAIAAYVA